jgi:hypothetical protein
MFELPPGMATLEELPLGFPPKLFLHVEGSSPDHPLFLKVTPYAKYIPDYTAHNYDDLEPILRKIVSDLVGLDDPYLIEEDAEWFCLACPWNPENFHIVVYLFSQSFAETICREQEPGLGVCILDYHVCREDPGHRSGGLVSNVTNPLPGFTVHRWGSEMHEAMCAHELVCRRRVLGDLRG